MTKKNELDEQKLDKVTGGDYGGYSGVHGKSDHDNFDYEPTFGGYVGSVRCACGCNKIYTHDVHNPLSPGTQLGTCSNGWIATADLGDSVKFYNPNTQETRTGAFEYPTSRQEGWDFKL